MQEDLLIFEIDDRRFGVSAATVVEVVRAVTPMSLPRVPEEIEGIINVRGVVVPVLDPRRLLGMSQRRIRYTDHFILVRDGELCFALHVDRAIDLAQCCEHEASDENPTDSPAAARRTGLIAETTLGCVQVLDPADLLSGDLREQLSSIVATKTQPVISRHETLAR